MDYAKINVILFYIILPIILVVSLMLNLVFLLGWLRRLPTARRH